MNFVISSSILLIFVFLNAIFVGVNSAETGVRSNGGPGENKAIKKLFLCLTKNAGVKKLLENSLGANFAKFFGQHCANGTNNRRSPAIRQPVGPGNSSEFAERLFNVGLDCLAQLGNHTNCCVQNKVPNYCLQFCGGGANAKNETKMELDKIIACKQYGNTIFSCMASDNKSREMSMRTFKSNSPDPKLCTGIDIGCRVVTTVFAGLTVVGIATGGVVSIVAAVGGFATGLSCFAAGWATGCIGCNPF